MQCRPLIFLVLLGLFLGVSDHPLQAERVVIELQDGSILRGDCPDPAAPGDLPLKTALGDLTVPRASIRSIFREFTPPTVATGTPSLPRQNPPETKETASETNENPPTISGRIPSEEPPLPPKKPDELLRMDDEDLLRLLEKGDLPLQPAPPAVMPAGRDAVDALYGLEDEDPVLPAGLEEVKVPFESGTSSAPLKAVDAQVNQILLGPETAETTLAPATVPAAVEPSSPAAGSPGTVEVYVPPPGTIDRKIFKNIEKHGGLPVKDEQFRQLKREEIDRLLEKHKPTQEPAD